MAGIYIHIPFCKQACYYCNFHFSVNKKNKEQLVNALLKEISLRKNYLDNEKIETIYFGGGTPSLLSGEEIKNILNSLQQNFEIEASVEVTLEANPDDLTKEKIKELRTTPINRFSIGVQSFHDHDLHYLHRAHNSEQAEASIRFSQDAGFENITVDLIYAIPTLTDEKWMSNLNGLNKFHIGHFSCYSLTVEKKTALEKFIREKKLDEVDDAQAANQFELLMDFAEKNDYDHYEISNFSKPGNYSKHNTSYWTGKKYLGLGPSAHSFDGISRQWNVSNNTLYIQSIEKGELLFEKEILSASNRFNEYIMTALRTKWGIDEKFLKENFGAERFTQFENDMERFLNDNLLVSQNEKIHLTRSGKLFADKIISELFETD